MVRGWGRSSGHSRTSAQTSIEEQGAISRLTGYTIPMTPAQATGGRAHQGGYYPNQTPKGKSSGRSTPYPQDTSRHSQSSWWTSSGWGSWWGSSSSGSGWWR